MIGDIAPKMAELTDDVLFGDVWERPGLSQRDRSLVTVAALVALYRTNELLRGIAAKHDKSVAQVVLRWLTQRDVVGAIPKSVRADRMAENLDVFDFELSADDLRAIATLDASASSFFDHRDPAVVQQLAGVQRTT